ncbi:cingulin-like [Manacus candei]|uniref:cingulin-like n=1 Tax=Manacus candei TaxID=415023 RepID=UPI00222653D5|nr:cingulin-like [Manacus candei]
MAQQRPDPRGPPSAPSNAQFTQLPPPSNSQFNQLPPPSNSQFNQLPPPSLGGLVPPSHFMLRPRSLGAELEAEKRRGQALEAELEAERGRSKALGAELEAERGRVQALGAELEAEKGRGQALEAELEALRGRVQALEAELAAEKGRDRALGAELESRKGRGQDKGVEPPSEEVQLRARLSALGQILSLQEPQQAPPPAQVRRWRQKVFELLVQVRTQEGTEEELREQVAARSRQVTSLELRLCQEGQEVSRQRLRAEAAEEKLRELGTALGRLSGSVGVALAQVTKVTEATRALGTLSSRLGRAGQRLSGLVALGRTRRHRDPEGTSRDKSVTPEVTSQQVTPARDGTGPPPGRVALASLLSHLQAVGSALLGDIGDPQGPVTSLRTRDIISDVIQGL